MPRGITAASTSLADLTALPFRAATFDACAQHSDARASARNRPAHSREIARSLAPGARLLLAAPHEWEVHQAPHDYFRYTRYGLQYLLEKAGFELLEIRAVGGYFRLLARRLLNGLQFFTGGIRWLGFIPAAILLVPPALILPFLDALDRERNFTAGYICTRPQADLSPRIGKVSFGRSNRSRQTGGLDVARRGGQDARYRADETDRPPGNAGPDRHRRAPAGASSGPRGWRNSTRAATRSTRAWCASAGLPIPTIARARPGEKRDVQVDGAELEALLERLSRRDFCRRRRRYRPRKSAGKRAYELARQSVAVELEPVKVTLYELTLLSVEGAVARLRAHCSGGTYMRSLAHDLGRMMGCGAHLEELRRTASAEFEIGEARTHGATAIAGRGGPADGCHRPGVEDAAGNPGRVRGRCDGGAHPPRPQLPGVAIPFGSGIAAREGAHAARGLSGNRGSGVAEFVPSGRSAVSPRPVG